MHVNVCLSFLFFSFFFALSSSVTIRLPSAVNCSSKQTRLLSQTITHTARHGRMKHDAPVKFQTMYPECESRFLTTESSDWLNHTKCATRRSTKESKHRFKASSRRKGSARLPLRGVDRAEEIDAKDRVCRVAGDASRGVALRERVGARNIYMLKKKKKKKKKETHIHIRTYT